MRQRGKEAIILCFPGGQSFVYHSHSWVSFHVWLLRYMNLYGRLPGSYILEFGTYSINAMHPKTRKILQLLRLRQVLHETCPLLCYKMVSGYCSFYLCFCLGHDGKYILLKSKEVQTICLLYCVFVVLVLLFLSYLGLRSLSHSLEIFEAKLNPLVSRCKHVLFLTFRSLYKHYVYKVHLKTSNFFLSPPGRSLSLSFKTSSYLP